MAPGDLYGSCRFLVQIRVQQEAFAKQPFISELVKAGNSEVSGLEFSGCISLLSGELSLGFASFAKGSEGKEGRKLATVPSREDSQGLLCSSPESLGLCVAELLGGRLRAAVCPPPTPRLRIVAALPALSAHETTGTAPGIWPVESQRSLHLRPGHAVLSRAPRQMGHADRTPPGVQGRARPARSPWSTVSLAASVDLCPARQPPSASPSSLCLPGGSAAAGPGPDSRAVPSVAEAWSEEQDACRVEPRGAVTPAPGKRVGGGVGTGTGCCRPRGPPVMTSL